MHSPRTQLGYAVRDGLRLVKTPSPRLRGEGRGEGGHATNDASVFACPFGVRGEQDDGSLGDDGRQYRLADPQPPGPAERTLTGDATALGEALQRLSEDPEVGTVVITGAGRGFCAGGDVKTMPERAAQGFEARVEVCAACINCP